MVGNTFCAGVRVQPTSEVLRDQLLWVAVFGASHVTVTWAPGAIDSVPAPMVQEVRGVQAIVTLTGAPLVSVGEVSGTDPTTSAGGCQSPCTRVAFRAAGAGVAATAAGALVRAGRAAGAVDVLGVVGVGTAAAGSGGELLKAGEGDGAGMALAGEGTGNGSVGSAGPVAGVDSRVGLGSSVESGGAARGSGLPKGGARVATGGGSPDPAVSTLGVMTPPVVSLGDEASPDTGDCPDAVTAVVTQINGGTARDAAMIANRIRGFLMHG